MPRLPTLSLALVLTSCQTASQSGGPAGTQPLTPPADAQGAPTQLQQSTRHGEWAMIRTGPADSVRAWVVYPERREKAPVVLVVHEIFGLTSWVRGVADQMAAAGFIAVAPDLLSGKGVPNDSAGEPVRDVATREIRTLDPDDVHRRLSAIAKWGMALPSATQKYGIVGFCWGGSTAFAHAVRAPDLGAAVVYYGGSPDTASLGQVRAPVLGLYGSDDARVNATVPPAQAKMGALGKTYEVRTYQGAGHGFLRQQGERDGANRAASEQAWQETIRWFNQHLR